MKRYCSKFLFLFMVLIFLLPVWVYGSSGAPHIDGGNVSLLWAFPFIGILLSIAVFPLLIPRIWHHHYGKISLFWGVLFITLLSINGFNVSAYYALEVYLLEFLPFITLLLALFTVSGLKRRSTTTRSRMPSMRRYSRLSMKTATSIHRKSS